MATVLSRQVFIALSMHAKLHNRLDTLDVRYQNALQQIEKQEILSYDDVPRFQELEAMKKELLSIRFLEKS